MSQETLDKISSKCTSLKSSIKNMRKSLDKFIRLYTELEQTVKSSLSDILEKNDKYTKNEIDKYKDCIEFKETG